jgi:transposase
MARVLCVYREVEILKQAAAQARTSDEAVAIVSYAEKTGMQAIATPAPDQPPKPGVYATFARYHEYKRHGRLSLLAGIDLITGKVHATVKDRHRSREFVELLKLLDAAYPADTAIKLILDDHSAQIAGETKAWLRTQPAGRFAFTLTPRHGSCFNPIEGFFSKLARSELRHIRVASKQELKIGADTIGIDPCDQHAHLSQMMRGHYAYYGISGDSRRIRWFVKDRILAAIDSRRPFLVLQVLQTRYDSNSGKPSFSQRLGRGLLSGAGTGKTH